MASEVFPSIDLLRESQDHEIEEVIKESQEALLEIRTQANFCPIEKPHLIRQHKRLIARCKTILRERRRS